MIEPYLVLKFLHILGAAVLFGTGMGIAFFLFWADRSREAAAVVAVARIVVVADYLFTATAVAIQPLTGVALAHMLGYSLTEGWLLASIGLYVLIGCFWLPVVFIQRRLRDLAMAAREAGAPLPPGYHRLMRIWFWLGWPAFAAILAIYWLMIAKPSLV